MSNKPVIRAFNDGAKWLKSQAQRRPKIDGKDRVENLLVAALLVLRSSPDHRRYRRRLNGMKRAIRNRAVMYVTRKWSREFSRLLLLASSDLETLPRPVPGLPIGNDLTPAQRHQRQYARQVGRAKKYRRDQRREAAVERRLSGLTTDHTGTLGADSEVLQNKGSQTPKIAKSRKSTKSRKFA